MTENVISADGASRPSITALGHASASPLAGPKDGFASVIHGLRQRFIRPAPLEGLADAIFTMGSRQQRAFGYGALSLRERWLYGLLRAHTVRPLDDRRNTGQPPLALAVGIRDIGRPFIERITEAPRQVGEDFGHIFLDEETQERVDEICTEARTEQLRTARPALDFFEDPSADELEKLMAFVKHGIDHIDPVIIYTHDETFTNFGTFNNLLGRMSEPLDGLLLDDLALGKERALSVEEKEFLFCFYALKLGGFRGEEFSGQQLTCATLDIYLASKLQDLRSIVGDSAAEQPTDLRERSLLCKEYRARLRPNYFVCRRINGLSFHKDELYVRRDAIDLSPAAVPNRIRDYVIRAYSKDSLSYASIDDYFADVVSSIAGQFEQPGPLGLNLLEDLMRLVIESSVEELHSSIGMSRGFRDLLRLQVALRSGDVKAICDYPTTDYYCAVFASPDARSAMLAAPGRFKRIMTAISTRMTFNSWHYTPGHFVAANSEGLRHFYHPPRMSDRAEWSDQHHTGHVQAGVRYSIRSPASLRLDGKKYYGMIDIRLMRDSEAYSDADLIRTKEYTAYLRAIMQAAADIALKTNTALPIRAFTKQWYASREGGEA